MDRETQVIGSQLGQLASGAQAGERQVRLFSGSDHEMHASRQVLDEVGEDRVDFRRVDNVVIVEDEEKLLRNAIDLVDEVSED